MTLCLHCGSATNNPKFCCRSCAASYNNRLFPKKFLGKTCCKSCQTPIKSGYTYCHLCLPVEEDYTLMDVMYDRHHKSSCWALVRSRARSACKHRKKICQNCGYNKHVEICHIKPIKDFPLTTRLSVVNAQTNLLTLCPNCHWEFDNKLLSF